MIRLSAAILAAFLFGQTAAAEPVCGPVEAALGAFRSLHGEVPFVTMRDATGQRLIILANPETGSWSLLVLPVGAETVACLVATGHDMAPVLNRAGRAL